MSADRVVSHPMATALWGGARAEWAHLTRSRLLLLLTVVQAVTFLLLVSLFGLTGSRAPTAVVDEDGGLYARHLIAELAATHHSFALRPMEKRAAAAALHRGDLVAVITIPHGFSREVDRGQTVALRVDVDNVDTDLTEDIQRALPSAIVAFGNRHRFSGIRLHVAELDLLPHDTDFIPYLVVSGLALDALVVAGILGAIAVARELESGTARMLAVVPVHPLVPLAGRILAIILVASIAMSVPVAVVVFGFGVVPVNALELVVGLVTSVAIFSCLGAALGAALRRTLPVASLVFGLSLPLYLDSGSLEPERFDGNLIWAIAHLSPVYYAVGLLEDAAHGLRVTPEPIFLDVMALAGWAMLSILLAGLLVGRRVRA